MMQVRLTTDIYADSKTLVEAMSNEDIACFCSEVAERLDGDFKDRHAAAKAFSAGLSEQGCRFIAEILASHYIRNHRKE